MSRRTLVWGIYTCYLVIACWGFGDSFRIPRLHQRNLWCDPLQLLLSGHQVVALSRSHKSLSRQQGARSTQHAARSKEYPHLPRNCRTLQQPPTRPLQDPIRPTTPHRHSKRCPVPSTPSQLPLPLPPKTLPRAGRAPKSIIHFPIQKRPSHHPTRPQRQSPHLYLQHPQHPQHHPKRQCSSRFQHPSSGTLRAPQRSVEAC